MARMNQGLTDAESRAASDRLQPAVHESMAGQATRTGKCVRVGSRVLRVLVVDDDKDTTDSMCMLVKFWGHEARQARDGATALAMASAYRPDVLLLDYAMPGMDGCWLARQLLRLPDLRESLFIAVTGYADPAHRLLCEAAGFDHVLAKPVEPPFMETLLQLEQARLAASPDDLTGTPRKCGIGILVVDDEECVRGVLDVWLRQQGFTVWLAEDGQEALDLYWSHRRGIQVVLLDVRMPGLDGPQTLAALHELNSRLCCCFMSGDLGDHTESSLRDAGAAAVIEKPFRLPEVTLLLQELASKAERRAFSM